MNDYILKFENEEQALAELAYWVKEGEFITVKFCNIGEIEVLNQRDSFNPVNPDASLPKIVEGGFWLVVTIPNDQGDIRNAILSLSQFYVSRKSDGKTSVLMSDIADMVFAKKQEALHSIKIYADGIFDDRAEKRTKYEIRFSTEKLAAANAQVAGIADDAQIFILSGETKYTGESLLELALEIIANATVEDTKDGAIASAVAGLRRQTKKAIGEAVSEYQINMIMGQALTLAKQELKQILEL